MTVQEWVDTQKCAFPTKQIRIVDSRTNKGTGTHWIIYRNFEVKNVKITKEWIFLYI